MKEVLILATYDEKGEGHALSISKHLEKEGCKALFIPMIRDNLPDYPYYFMDATGKDVKAYLRYKLWYLRVRLGEIPFAPYRVARNRFQGNFHVGSKEILKKLNKLNFAPSYIIIGAYNHFLSPRTIYELYLATKATIVLIMMDAKLLSGGCVYPIDCEMYKTGCCHCPQFPYFKFIARNIYRQKEKYLSKIPLHIAGTEYDLKRANFVPYLKNAVKHQIIEYQPIPFYMEKSEARKKFGLDQDDYVIMAGAVDTVSRHKGFKELSEALSLFSKYKGTRRKTLMVMTHNTQNLNIPEGINVVLPGFLDLKGLFTAFYACDVFASSSIDDSGPFMVNYSVACGRPVVAFSVGIALDLIEHKETGYLAKCIDSDDYALGLDFFYHKNNDELKLLEKKLMKHISSFANKHWYNFILDDIKNE